MKTRAFHFPVHFLWQPASVWGCSRLSAPLPELREPRSSSAVQRCSCLCGRHKYTQSSLQSILAPGQGILWLKPDCACPTCRGRKNRLQLHILCTRGKYRNSTHLQRLTFFFFFKGILNDLHLLLKVSSCIKRGLFSTIVLCCCWQTVMTHLTVAREESPRPPHRSKLRRFWLTAMIIL